MPSFRDSALSPAPPEQIWKLLYDPSRFPEWWAGIETVERQNEGSFTMYPDGYPDYPMAQLLETQREHGRVTVSCLVSDLRFDWLLEPADDEGTLISVEVEIPDVEAHRLESQREIISASLKRLARLAAE